MWLVERPTADQAMAYVRTGQNATALILIRHFNAFRPDKLHWVCPACQMHISSFKTSRYASRVDCEGNLEASIEFHEARDHEIPPVLPFYLVGPDPVDSTFEWTFQMPDDLFAGANSTGEAGAINAGRRL